MKHIEELDDLHFDRSKLELTVENGLSQFSVTSYVMRLGQKVDILRNSSSKQPFDVIQSLVCIFDHIMKQRSSVNLSRCFFTECLFPKAINQLSYSFRMGNLRLASVPSKLTFMSIRCIALGTPQIVVDVIELWIMDGVFWTFVHDFSPHS